MAIHGHVLTGGGDDVTVRAGARVTLGRTSSPGTLTYAWTQTGGPKVTLDDATSATPSFIAPSVSSRTDLTFSLTVSDGTDRSTDTVTVTVLPSRVKRASVDGDELSVTFDTALDATSKPAGSAFTVTARKTGSSRTIAGTAASVAISGATVTATLSAAVAADERLTVRYDKPASGAVLKDSGGAALASFPDRPAGNIGGDTTAPGVKSVAMNGATLTVVYDEGAGRERDAGGGHVPVRRGQRLQQRGLFDGGLDFRGHRDRDVRHARATRSADTVELCRAGGRGERPQGPVRQRGADPGSTVQQQRPQQHAAGVRLGVG